MHNTILLQVNSPKTIQFLYELQELDLVKVLKVYSTPVKTKLSDKYKGVFSKEDSISFNEHTKTMRNEWNGI
jgi:hypothetical protein